MLILSLTSPFLSTSKLTIVSLTVSQVALRIAWCDLVLEQVETSIGNRNKHIEDLKNKNKALPAQMDDLNKTYVMALSDLSKASEEKKNLEAMLSNQEASIQTLTISLASTREKVQKKKEEIAALLEACIDKFDEGANHMKTILFQDFQEGIYLSCDVDKFLAEQEEAQKLAADSDGLGSNDSEDTTTKAQN